MPQPEENMINRVIPYLIKHPPVFALSTVRRIKAAVTVNTKATELAEP